MDRNGTTSRRRRREMFSMARQRVFIAMVLMAVLFLGGAVSAQARDRNTNGSDRLVKGAAAGADSDYKQEKDARRDAEREADYYASQSYRNNRGRAYRNDNRGANYNN